MSLRSWFIDKLVRRKAALHETALDRFTCRVARSVEEYDDAFRLVDLAFVYEGIKGVRGISLRITPQHVLPEATVLVVYEEGMLVGTMTVTVDSPAGLPLEKDYPDEVARLRRHGAKMVEYGSLALVRRRWNSGASTLLSMAAVWLSRNVLDASHIVIGINPRATPFYRGIYGFSSIGAAQDHAELNAPVQGMVCPVARVIESLRRHYPRPMASGLRIDQHFGETLPSCVTVEALGDGEDWARWKMPREVFQELFVRRSDRLRTLDPQTRAHLEIVRSPRTFEVGLEEAVRRRSQEIARPGFGPLRVVS